MVILNSKPNAKVQYASFTNTSKGEVNPTLSFHLTYVRPSTRIPSES